MLLLVKLRFRSALRIGAGDQAQDENFIGIIHSDTLFSALINEWTQIYPGDSIEGLVARFSEEPPFRISSAFPFRANEFYLPTPIGTSDIYMGCLKDVPFLELFDFIDLAEGKHNAIMKKQLKNPAGTMMFNHLIPRVSIDRMSTATNIFHAAGWLFERSGGLYVLLDLKDETLREKLELCIRSLGQSGIGGDKSVGYGLFDPEFEVADALPGWPELVKQREQENKVHCTLSLCQPSGDEAKEAISYQLLTRRGWIFSHSSTKQMKKRECWMFAEGSLFRNPVKGKITDITPTEFKTDHNVYRYGLSISVQISM